jgi:hypothetical protein
MNENMIPGNIIKVEIMPKTPSNSCTLLYSYYNTFFVNIFSKMLRKIAPNVPAVYDVFAVAIKERGAFQQPQKCGGEKSHKGRRPSRLPAAKRKQSCYAKLGRTSLFFILFS